MSVRKKPKYLHDSYTNSNGYWQMNNRHSLSNDKINPIATRLFKKSLGELVYTDADLKKTYNSPKKPDY